MTKRPLNIYYVDFPGIFLDGHAIIVARDREHVKRILKKRIEEAVENHRYGDISNKLKYDVDDTEIMEIIPDETGAHVFISGDY